MIANLLELPTGLRLLRRVSLPHKLGLLDRIYGQWLGQQGIRWVECSNGVCWKLDMADVCHRWIVYGDYQGSIGLNWLRQWMKGGGTVVDSGSNIGQMLLYLAPIPAVRIYAVEPLPTAAEWLRECVNAQEGWDVHVIESGLSECQGEVKIQCAGAQSTTRLDWYTQKHFETLTVQVDSFDNLMSRYGEQSIRLWKIDVEGVEYEVLLGARRYLQRHAIEAIFLEVLPVNFQRVKDLLAEFGYALFVLNSQGALVPCDSKPEKVRDLIALRKSA